jgi:hypothetical protein
MGASGGEWSELFQCNIKRRHAEALALTILEA